MHLARRHRLGPADPRLPRGARRRRRADGLGVPAARHEPRRPPRLPRGDQRHLRLVHAHGRHLVGVRQHRDARRDPPLGGRGDRVPGRRHAPRTASRSPTSRRPTSSTRASLPPPEELQELDRRGDRGARGGARPTSSVRGRSSPESNPAFGEAKATVDEHFVEFPDEELGLEGAADYVTVYSFETGGKEDLPDDPSRWDRITHKVKTTFCSFEHPPRYAIIQVQPVIEQEAEPGAGAAHPRGRRRRSRWCR